MPYPLRALKIKMGDRWIEDFGTVPYYFEALWRTTWRTTIPERTPHSRVGRKKCFFENRFVIDPKSCLLVKKHSSQFFSNIAQCLIYAPCAFLRIIWKTSLSRVLSINLAFLASKAAKAVLLVKIHCIDNKIYMLLKSNHFALAHIAQNSENSHSFHFH